MHELAPIRDAWGQMHDPLTGMPVAGLFYDRVHRALLVGRREHLQVVLMLLDIDLAHRSSAGEPGGLDAGQRDELLSGISGRIVASLRVSDSGGRIDAGGGGHQRPTFGVMLPHSLEEGVPLVAGRIMVNMLRPFTVAGHALLVRSSVGIAVAPDPESPAVDTDTLFGQAREALEMARLKGGGFEAYSSQASQDLLERAQRATG